MIKAYIYIYRSRVLRSVPQLSRWVGLLWLPRPRLPHSVPRCPVPRARVNWTGDMPMLLSTVSFGDNKGNFESCIYKQNRTCDVLHGLSRLRLVAYRMTFFVLGRFCVQCFLTDIHTRSVLLFNKQVLSTAAFTQAHHCLCIFDLLRARLHNTCVRCRVTGPSLSTKTQSRQCKRGVPTYRDDTT